MTNSNGLLMRLDIRNELFKGFVRRVFVDEQDLGSVCDNHDRCKVTTRIVREFLVDSRTCYLGAQIAYQYGVAIRCSTCDASCCNRTARTGDIFDDYWLAKCFT